MPPAPLGTCILETVNRKCFQSGETRANENSVLSSVQTLFVREHNRIARSIKALRPKFNDEQLFQEARRVLIAEYQHIIYNEWLPLIIGRDFAKSNYLLPSSKAFKSYDSSIDFSTFNEFGTAAFRFGHTLLKSTYTSKDANLNQILEVSLLDIFLNPTPAYQNQGLDGFFRGAMTELASKPDGHITDVVHNHLFEIFAKGANVTIRSSLSALNINRGRDHGVQPYIKYRKLCNLPSVQSFNDLTNIPADIVSNLSKIYNSVDDIDLFAGGLSETPLPGANVGPTFACIIARQFKELKFSDRYYYEYSLTTKELNEIKKASMARLICDNMDVSKIPLNPFLPVTGNNQFVNCSALPRVNATNIFI